MDDGVVIVRVDGADVGGHRELLDGGLGVFLAKIPIQGWGVTEAGDDFTAVEFAAGERVGVGEILDGKLDGVPEGNFYMKAGLDSVSRD